MANDIDVTTETTALAPRLLGALALTDPTQLRAQLDAYTLGRKTFIDWVYANLAPGTDWQLIHRKIGRGQSAQPCPQKGTNDEPRCGRCGGKATLCKPGAEKVCGLLQLTPRFRRDEETWMMLGAEPGMVCVICELVDRTGAVVAEGRGARTKEQDYGEVNKTIKMVQKSAQIDAVLRCAGLSEVFTQDLEDTPIQGTDEEPRGFQPPRRKSEGATGPSGPQCPPGQDDDEPRDLAAEMRAQEASGTPPPPAQAPEASPASARGGGHTADRTHGASGVSATTQVRGGDAQQSLVDVPPPPKDAISEGRVRRLYALLHEELRNVDRDDVATFTAAKLNLKAWVKAHAVHNDREHLEHIHWKDYDAVCDAIVGVVQATTTTRRSHARKR